MLIEIKAATVGSLRVIERLPLDAVTQLEGFNGVGKSSAIRVLMVCVGKNPYPDNDQAWSTFRNSLRQVEVTVSGGPKDSEIRWVFDAEKWPEGARIADNWFEAITIDGKAATLSQVSSVFNVERFTGESGITETFAAELSGHKASLFALAERLTESERDRKSPEAGAQETLESLIALTQHLDLGLLARDKATIAEKQDALDEVQSESKAVDDRASQLQAARELESGLQQLESVEPEVRSSLADAESSVKAVESERSELTAKLAELPTGLDKHSQTELARAQKNLTKNRDLYDAASLVLADLLAVTELGSLEGLGSRMSELQQERRQLIAQRATLSLNPDTASLGRQGAQMLRLRAALLDQQILPSGYASDPSVGALAAALEERSAQLNAFPDSDELTALKDQIENIEQRLRQLDEVSSAAHERDRTWSLIQKHSTTVDQLTAEGSDSSEAESLRNRASELDREYSEAVQRRALLRHQLDVLLQGGDAGARRARADEILRRHETDVSELPTVLQATLETQARLRADLAEAEADFAAADVVGKERLRRLAAAVEQLTSGSYKWLPAALALSDRPESHEQAASLVSEVHRAAESALSRLLHLSENVLAAGAALDEIAESLTQPAAGGSNRRYMSELTQWAQDEFAGYFSKPPIRDNLLGSDATDVEIDISSASVRWVIDGEVMSRRLDTFSSGEQAFAYARARIGLLDSSAGPATVRLICLDEFGAFMDFDRRSALVSFLRDRAKAHPTDSVLLILPLRRDIESESLAAIGSERDALNEIKEQLKSQGYILEKLA